MAENVKFATRFFKVSAEELKKEEMVSFWKIRRMITSEDKKNGIQRDTEKVIGTISTEKPDEFTVAETVLTFDEELSVEEYKDVIGAVLEQVAKYDFASMFRIRTEGLTGNQEEALWNLGFIGDPLDRDYLIRQYEGIRWLMIFYMLGMGCGSGLGIIGNQIGLGMSGGMLIGMALGGFIDMRNRKKKKQLWTNRLNSRTSTK